MLFTKYRNLEFRFGGDGYSQNIIEERLASQQKNWGGGISANSCLPNIVNKNDLNTGLNFHDEYNSNEVSQSISTMNIILMKSHNQFSPYYF